MQKYGYSLNQISTEVAPYIRERIRVESEIESQSMREKAQRELERKIKLDPIKEQYLKFRNEVFAELYYEINQNTLNTINCKEISNSLLAKKVIKINKWIYKQLSILFLITGIIYGVLYWIFDSVKNAAESTGNIIIGIIGGAVLFPAVLRMTLRPVELQTEEIFRGTGFSVNDLDSSIIECDDNILKLIKCSLDGDKAEFGEILKKSLCRWSRLRYGLLSRSRRRHCHLQRSRRHNYSLIVVGLTAMLEAVVADVHVGI